MVSVAQDHPGPSWGLHMGATALIPECFYRNIEVPQLAWVAWAWLLKGLSAVSVE